MGLKRMQVYQILPLALIYHAEGEIEGRTRIQKLAFLADQRLEENGIDPYEFKPYDYGPFDKKVYEALEFLEREGLIGESKTQTFGGDKRYDYKLTKKGLESVKQNIPEENAESIGELSSDVEDLLTVFNVAKEVIEEYDDMPISNLLDHVYDEYPEYATESVLY